MSRNVEEMNTRTVFQVALMDDTVYSSAAFIASKSRRDFWGLIGDYPVHKHWWRFSRCENPIAERSARRRNFVASAAGVHCARTDAGATGRSATSSTRQLR
jgi:hypothetical protein